MLDAPTQAVLLNIVRRSGQSLLQYVHDSFPWAASEEQNVLADLQSLIQEEREAVATVAHLLQRHHTAVPPFGTFPTSYTGINYVSLDYLLPQLADRERRAAAELEADLGRVTDTEAHDAVQLVLEMKHRHQKTLETMADGKRMKDEG